MNKKNFLRFASVFMILCLCMGSSSFAAPLGSSSFDVPQNKVLYNYLYNDLDRLLSSIDLLSKTVITASDDKISEKKDEYVKEIESYINEITYISSQVGTQYDEYKNDKPTLDGLYGLSLVLSELRFALVELRNYMLTESDDDAYSLLESFFIIKAEAERKINNAKKSIPK